MKDKWMNIGYESDELQPYHEPEADLNDDLRIRKSTLIFIPLYAISVLLHLCVLEHWCTCTIATVQLYVKIIVMGWLCKCTPTRN